MSSAFRAISFISLYISHLHTHTHTTIPKNNEHPSFFKLPVNLIQNISHIIFFICFINRFPIYMVIIRLCSNITYDFLRIRFSILFARLFVLYLQLRIVVSHLTIYSVSKIMHWHCGCV